MDVIGRGNRQEGSSRLLERRAIGSGLRYPSNHGLIEVLGTGQ
jgi:hypothetical protein